MIYDVHTHSLPVCPGEAIVQLTPDAFFPQPGHFYAVGLHPWFIGADWRNQMARLLVMALHPQVAMIGEAGVDKKNGSAPVDLQLEVFREHVCLSELVRKPLVIHCVKGIDEVVAVRKEMKATQPWVIHGFRGGVEQWRQLSRLGIRVSIGARCDAALLGALPLDQLLVESDDAGDVAPAYEVISAAKQVDASALRACVATNIYHLLVACRAE